MKAKETERKPSLPEALSEELLEGVSGGTADEIAEVTPITQEEKKEYPPDTMFPAGAIAVN